MFQTSQDILNLTLSVSAAAVAFFVCWFLYYGIMSLRQAYKITKDAGEVVKEAKETVIAFKEKIKDVASYFIIMNEGIKKMMDYIKGKSTRKKGNDDAQEEKPKGKKIT